MEISRRQSALGKRGPSVHRSPSTSRGNSRRHRVAPHALCKSQRQRTTRAFNDRSTSCGQTAGPLGLAEVAFRSGVVATQSHFLLSFLMRIVGVRHDIFGVPQNPVKEALRRGMAAAPLA